MTAQDLIASALKRIGVLGAGETPSGQDAADGLLRLNDLIDAWATERLAIYTVTRTTWAIVSGTGSYTVGVGGTVNVARPVFIDAVKIIDTAPNPDLEMAIGGLLTEDAYAAIAQKALTAPQPAYAYYNPTYPLGTLTFWPVPTSTTLQGVLYAPAAVAQLAALSTTISLPPGYQRFLTSNLAVELAPEFGVQPSQSLVASAIESKADIKRANIRLVDLAIDRGAFCGRGRSSYSILTDA